jgi:hypothetical protein
MTASAPWHSWHLNRGTDWPAAPLLPPVRCFISPGTTLPLGRLHAEPNGLCPCVSRTPKRQFICDSLQARGEIESEEEGGGVGRRRHAAEQDSTGDKTRTESGDRKLTCGTGNGAEYVGPPVGELEGGSLLLPRITLQDYLQPCSLYACLCPSFTDFSTTFPPLYLIFLQ